VQVAIQRLPHGRDLPLPSYQSEDAVGLDLQAALEEDLTLRPGSIAAIPCGFCLAIPKGYEGQIRPRSGLALRHGLSIPNAPGTIDPDYRGEVKAILVNLGAEAFVVKRGMRIAQLVILPVPRVRWDEVGELPPTPRAESGFGHTGI
jgi:dUTP pyrophosphatase